MSASHRELDLSLSQNIILLRIKYFKINKSTIRKHPERYSFLLEYYLVNYYRHDHQYYVLNNKAKMYLRFRFKDSFRFWTPIVISVIALFGGYDIYTNPVLERLLQAIATLVKTILESLGAVF